MKILDRVNLRERDSRLGLATTDDAVVLYVSKDRSVVIVEFTGKPEGSDRIVMKPASEFKHSDRWSAKPFLNKASVRAKTTVDTAETYDTELCYA